jgi:hypothetical protein
MNPNLENNFQIREGAMLLNKKLTGAKNRVEDLQKLMC